MATVVLTALGCDDGRTDLRVRTGFPLELRDEVEGSFEAAHPSVDVRFSEGPPDPSPAALAEGPPFDVWWGGSALALERAADDGLLLDSRPSWSDGGEARPWHSILRTPMVIAFDRTTVPIAEAPSEWIDVFHHGWYGEVRALDPASTEAGAYLVGSIIVEAIRDDDDPMRGFDWLARLHEQVDVYGTTPEELVRALGSGDALLAILPRADAEGARGGEAEWLHYRIPTLGTPTLLRGVAVGAETGVVEAAHAFVDHLGTTEVVTAMKLHTRWEPLMGEVDASRLPPDFELEQRWTAYPPAVDTLVAELDGWIRRWEEEVRARE